MRNGKFSRLWDMVTQQRLEIAYDRIVFPAPTAGPRRLLNYLLSQVEGRLRLLGVHSYPFGLQLEPTVECPLDCPLCPRHRVIQRGGPAHMPWDRFARLMDEMGPYLTALALWQWGEPLLHPRIVDMARLAHRHGIITFLSTNGQVDPEAADLGGLMRSGLDMLIVSLDGIRQEAYASFRAGGEVSKVLRFIREAARARPPGRGPLINVRIIATRGNESEIGAVESFAREAGADLFSVKGVSLYTDASPGNPSLPGDRRWRTYQYRGEAEAAAYRQAPNLCRKPWIWPTLRYDGTLLICECDHLHESPLGNVFREGSFRAVWRGAAARWQRARFGRDGRIDLEFCGRCRYKINDAIREVMPLRAAGLGARLAPQGEPLGADARPVL